MSSLVVQLATAFDLQEDSSEEELSLAILALLKSAATSPDSENGVSLSKIAHEVSQAGAASLLGPLDVLPVLLPCKDPSAKEILSLMGECSSAKELVMANQEALERLASTFDDEDEDDEDDDDGPTTHTVSYQLTTLVELYSACIPRLKLRRKTVSETVSPLLTELKSAIQLMSAHLSCDEGRGLLSAVAHLVKRLETWSKSVVDGGNMDEFKGHLLIFLDHTIVCCEHAIKSSLAQRTFESIFSKYTARIAVEPGWEGGVEVMSGVIDTYLCLGITPTLIFSKPSLPAMIVFAHSGSQVVTLAQLEKAIPVLVGAIQASLALDEALAILLYALGPFQTPPKPYLAEEVIYPLFTVIPALCSSHPDSLVRHQAFRILSVLLSLCPPPLRMQLLGELTSDQDFPQMRVASVGLVKEAVLEGLAHPPHLFASPNFCDFFGPILFRPNPQDLLSDTILSIDDFKESSEPMRLIECLGTYYTILQRDKSNLTCVRNSDAMDRVEMALLTPLRQALDRWANQPDSKGAPVNDRLFLGSLQMCIERVDSAIAGIRAGSSVNFAQ